MSIKTLATKLKERITEAKEDERSFQEIDLATSGSYTGKAWGYEEILGLVKGGAINLGHLIGRKISEQRAFLVRLRDAPHSVQETYRGQLEAYQEAQKLLSI